MTNPGILREWADVLELAASGGQLAWQKKRRISVQAAITGTGTVSPYSTQKREAVRFLVRRQSITQNHLILYQDRTYQITQKKPSGQLYLELSAVLAPVLCCELYGTETAKDSLNRPQETRKLALAFPGFLSEKSVLLQEEAGHNETQDTFVLTAPKQVQADEGKLVRIQDVWYEITGCHRLGDWWDDYEIRRRRDN